MTRMRVDFNSRGPEGTVRGSRSRADGPVEVGDSIEIYDPAEPDMVYEGKVVDLDPDTGRLLVAVYWEPTIPERALLSDVSPGGRDIVLDLSVRNFSGVVAGNRVTPAGVPLSSGQVPA